MYFLLHFWRTHKKCNESSSSFICNCIFCLSHLSDIDMKYLLGLDNQFLRFVDRSVKRDLPPFCYVLLHLLGVAKSIGPRGEKGVRGHGSEKAVLLLVYCYNLYSSLILCC